MHIKKDMQVYYCCPVQGDRSNIDYCRRTVDLMKGMGIEVLTDYLVAEKVNDEFKKSFSCRRIKRGAIIAESVKLLYRASHLVADFSTASTGVGVEVGLALHRHLVLGNDPMPILCLYNKKIKKTASIMIGDLNFIPNFETVMIEGYESVNEIKNILSVFFK